MSKVTINYKVEGEEWDNAVTKAFEKLNKKVKIDGFREGKAPRNIFEKKYGKENLYVEASDELIHHKYHHIIEEEKIIPIVEPRVEPIKVDETGIEVNFVFITDPEVKLGKYKGLGVKKEEVTITKEEIKHELDHLTEKYAELVSKDGEVKKGDVAIIDFEGFKDGAAFEGGKSDNYSLTIGSNSFIPGFEEAIIGMKKGDTKDINLTFPEDYMAENLKGQEVIFKVKLNDIKERIIPELGADFYEDLGLEGVTNEEQLNKEIENNIKAHKEMDIENKFIDDLLKAASSNMTIEIDEEIIAEEVDRMFNQFMERMTMQGITEELYFEYTKTTKEKLLEQMHPEAESRVKYRYLLDAIAREEKIDPSYAEAETEAENYAEKYNMTKEQFLNEFGGIEMVRYDLKMKKAIELLKENN